MDGWVIRHPLRGAPEYLQYLYSEGLLACFAAFAQPKPRALYQQDTPLRESINVSISGRVLHTTTSASGRYVCII